jgi:hypothetical protein
VEERGKKESSKLGEGRLSFLENIGEATGVGGYTTLLVSGVREPYPSSLSPLHLKQLDRDWSGLV